jgi:hypothetical protein
MRNARSSILVLGLLAPWFVPHLTPTAAASTGPMAREQGLIRARQSVPDDPLAGLPSEDDGRPSRGGKSGGTKGSATCAIDGKPANQHDIGDLRAALAVVERGPRYWSCPSESASGGIGLRITIDGHGKITAAEPVGRPPEVATAIAKKLNGKSIAARREGSTTGTVWLTFTPAKAR